MTLIHKFEIIVLAVILGLITPVIGLLIFWFGSVPLLPEKWIIVAAVAGTLLGLVVDAIYLRRWVRKAWDSARTTWSCPIKVEKSRGRHLRART